MLRLAIALLGLGVCLCDINMHNPRGSNNRHDESSRSRANGERLFDSQNNDRGGHNSGGTLNQEKMYYYGGSKVEIQWAHQHSCSDENNNCQVVIQYMCDDDIRDGSTTKTIPVEGKKCANNNCDQDPAFGRHESQTYYEKCASRERNKGLFVPGKKTKKPKNLLRDSAQSTRQNPKGTRRGYECPEERDYYPYFGNSPWIDIAVFTNGDCEYYQRESQNVKKRFGCDMPDEYWKAVRGKLLGKDKRTDVILTYDRAACDSTEVTVSGKTYRAYWRKYKPHRKPPPDCLVPQWTRDNHQGNTLGGEFMSYWWTVPNVNAKRCVIRIRYNISTNDFDYWDTDHTDNTGPEIIWRRMGFPDEKTARKRGYIFQNNPKLDIFNLGSGKGSFRLAINVDVAKFGRTFQDRSHAFSIKKRKRAFGTDKNIYNINVRGKRGNIVQTFPSTEYDFVPSDLMVNRGDYVHFQWTGSDNNNRGNNGQGTLGTDRSNVVQLALRPYAEGSHSNKKLTLGTNYPRPFNSTEFLGLTSDMITKLAFNGKYTNNEVPGVTLNNANAYYDAGLIQVNTAGIFHYFSTRNNAFSNRNQKATIYVV